jgi:AraC-like DNA-binding protein
VDVTRVKMMKSIVCEKRTYKNESETHSHSCSQLILPLEGELVLKTNKNDFVVDEKHILLLPSDCSHSYHARSSNKFLVMDIPSYEKDIFTGVEFNYEYYQYLDKKWKAIRYLLLEESKDGDNSSLINLAEYACSLLKKEERDASIKYIHDNYQSKISIQKLAKIENFNLSYYIEWFTKKNGMTPNVYIQKLRLAKAKELLVETDLSLTMIAQYVGYEQQSSLTRLFKNYEKISPSKYRKLKRM